MVHCPYCLSAVPENDFVCPACGAEKGYLYFNRKSRGLIFLVVFGFLAPVAVVLAIPFYFQGIGASFWVAVTIALGIGIFTVHRLIVGPTWYR